MFRRAWVYLHARDQREWRDSSIDKQKAGHCLDPLMSVLSKYRGASDLIESIHLIYMRLDEDGSGLVTIVLVRTCSSCPSQTCLLAQEGLALAVKLVVGCSSKVKFVVCCTNLQQRECENSHTGCRARGTNTYIIHAGQLGMTEVRDGLPKIIPIELSVDDWYHITEVCIHTRCLWSCCRGPYTPGGERLLADDRT